MSRVIATVSLRPPRSGLGVEVCFSFPGTGETVYLPLPDRRLLEGVRRKAGHYLQRLVALVPRLNPTADQAAEALRLLLNSGRELAGLLAQDDPERCLTLQDAFRRAWPVWESTRDGAPDESVPTVEVLCHDDTLPLELLPVFDFGALPQPGTYDDLARAAARFLGFSTAVRRVVPAPASGDHVLRNDPTLPVQFLRYRQLSGPGEEERFLATLHDYVRLEGPWPVAHDEPAFRTALTRALYDGVSLDGGLATEPPVQVQHFACHCDTTAELDDDYTLTMSTRLGGRRQVSFGELRQAYYERFFSDRGRSRQRAVIVLNACGSSRMNPLTAFSFPRWFLNHGHRAFIGTETDIPDAVAARFATAFYRRLLESRRPLGKAIVRARWDLLRDFRNPLGLLYVVYGDADLTVERPRPGIRHG